MQRLRHTCAHMVTICRHAPAAVGPDAGIGVDTATVTAVPDSYGNRWALTAEGRGVAVSPSFVPPITSLDPDAQPWMLVDGPQDQGSEALVGVSPDEAGFVWLATATRLWVMSPRAAESGPFEPGPGHAGKPTANTAGPEWRLVPAPMLSMTIAGLSRSHADAPAVLLISPSGDNVELMIGADGKATVGPPTARPGAGVWEPLGRLPAGNHDIFCCELGGKLWLSGGLTIAGFPAHNHCFDSLWSMDPSTGRWETISHMPLPRMYNGLVNFNGEIWAIGGHANREQPTSARGWRDSINVTECLVTGHIFNPTATEAWRDAPDLNVKRPRPFPGGPCVVVACGRIWAIATGRDSSGRETVESIGVGEAGWRMERSLPPSVLHHDNEWSWAAGGVATVVGDVIYLCAQGGFISLDTSAPQGELEWNTSLRQHPTSTAAEPNGQPLCACVVGHKAEVWVLGGAGRTLGDTHIFTPAVGEGKGSWRVGPPMPTAQAWAGAASHAGHLYVLSGGHKMQYHPDPMAGSGATHYDDRCWRLIEQ